MLQCEMLRCGFMFHARSVRESRMHDATLAQKLVLGSTSIYRRELLERLRLPFQRGCTPRG